MKQAALCAMALFLFCSTAFAGIPEKDDLLAGVQPGADGKIDVLTVFAHQDDESIYGGGTLVKMSKDPRVRIHIMCLTLGDQSEAKDKLGITPEHLGRIRSAELVTAAQVYNAVEVIQLNYHDGHLSEADPEKLITDIKDVIDRTGAEVIFTHDPLGITSHPDHIACSKAATEAFRRSNAALLYYPTLPPFLYHALIKLTPVKNYPPPALPTIKVDISKEKVLKRMAVYAHASQKHFTSVGFDAEAILVLDHEYFARVTR